MNDNNSKPRTEHRYCQQFSDYAAFVLDNQFTHIMVDSVGLMEAYVSYSVSMIMN